MYEIVLTIGKSVYIIVGKSKEKEADKSRTQ